MQVKTTQLTCTQKMAEGKDMLVRIRKLTDLHLSTKKYLGAQMFRNYEDMF